VIAWGIGARVLGAGPQVRPGAVANADDLPDSAPIEPGDGEWED
jgi:hypothetical protein